MEIALSLIIGIALSATSGFRVFVPFLALSAANLAGWLELSQSFAWIGSWPALVMFGVATLMEILAYFIPIVDNALTAISIPISAVAGIVLTLSVLGDVGPELSWILAIIGGGGSSLVARTVSNLVHAGSTAASGGTANPVVSLAESAGSVILSVLAILAPIFALVLFSIIIYWTTKVFRRFKSRQGGLA